MKVLADKILVRPLDTPKKESLLYIPSLAKDDYGRFKYGVVEQVGKKVEEVSVKDRIYFDSFNASKFTIDGLEAFVIVETAVLVVE